MMKLTIILIMFLMPVLVNAQGLGHCLLGKYPLGHCEIEDITITPSPSSGKGGGAGAGLTITKNITGLLYDVVVSISPFVYSLGETLQVAPFVYTQGGTLNIVISIINKEGIPSKDSVVTYYLLSPSNEKFGEIKEAVLPKSKEKITLEREIKLPVDMEPGQWKLVVLFDPIEAESIEASITFEAVSKKNISQQGLVIIALIILSIMVYNQTKNENINK